MDEIIDNSKPSQAFKSVKNWEFFKEYPSKDDFYLFLFASPFKMTSTHGNQTSTCLFHNIEKHLQVYGYYKCVSTRCLKGRDDVCSFQFKVNECTLDSFVRVYQFGTHNDKYENSTSNKRPGISSFYKEEILKLLSDEANKTPFSILKILTKRNIEGLINF